MTKPCPRCLDLRPGDLLSPAAIEWLKHGERGLSSEAIFSHLSGIPLGRYGSPPADVGDYKRCRKLLAMVPEFASRFGEMANVSVEWALLVEHWDAIGALVDRGNQAAAYIRMRNIADEAYAARKDAK